jgi:hypothetical protein
MGARSRRVGKAAKRTVGKGDRLMSRGAQSFKQGDVTSAIKGVVKAGMSVGRVEIENGKIIVFAGDADPDEAKID